MEFLSKIIDKESIQSQSKEINKQVLTPSPAHLSSITPVSMSVHISIRIGHRQQNIHLLQDGGDDQISPIITCNLSKTTCLSSVLAGWSLLDLSQSIFPRCPAPRTASTLWQSPCHPCRVQLSAKPTEHLKSEGTWLPDDINFSESWGGLVYSSFQRVEQGKGESHHNSY